ncbi:hypothetical protein MJD09_20585, partial [bacterium]|nr:hypothetical protein [bacterium]
LTGSERAGWLLTEQGLHFARRHIDTLRNSDLSEDRLSRQEKQWREHEYDRLFGEPAFLKFEAGEGEKITEHEAEAFFRLNDYIVGKTREEKVQRILNAFGDDTMLGEAVKEMATKVYKG